MSSRRSLLQSGAYLAVLTRNHLFGEPRTIDSDASLPSSIAALKSLRDQAKPISVDERRQRIVNAQRFMAANNIDAVLLPGGTSLFYFTGIRWFGGERLFAVVLTAKGKPLCISPAFEEGRAREQLNRGPLEQAEVLTWQENENPYRLVASSLRGAGIATGTLGIEEATPWLFSDGIAKAAPALRLTSAAPVTAGCRMRKSPAEIALMQLANRATLNVYKAVYQALQPGMTQTNAASLIRQAYTRVGFPGEASVQVGPWSANPHGSSTPQVIRENDIVMIDDGCTVEGYNSDITRTFVLGKGSARMNAVFQVVKKAQAAAFAAARPGAQCQQPDAAARKVIDEAGYGPAYRHFTHRVGHGIGLDGHEWPYLVGGNTLPLQPGMTCSDEPGIYLPNEFGIRLEDDIYITEEGAAWFTQPSPSLEHPFD